MGISGKETNPLAVSLPQSVPLCICRLCLSRGGAGVHVVRATRVLFGGREGIGAQSLGNTVVLAVILPSPPSSAGLFKRCFVPTCVIEVALDNSAERATGGNCEQIGKSGA